MTEVVKIDGCPGGGKTHTLKEKLREEKRQGIEPGDFYWLNFTNAGREDVEVELGEIFPDTDGDVERRAKTVHGLALSLCIQSGVIAHSDVDDVVIQQGSFPEEATDPYAEFCRQQAMPYDPQAANPRKLLAGEKDTDYTGNKVFAINDYLRQTCKPPHKWRSAPVNIRISGDRVTTLLREWDRYKREAFDNRRYEHGDYVAEVIDRGLVPSADVLLIDEFQDLAPLEYRLYKLWRDSGKIGTIYISGDPNQSIYSFRGGTPVYFEQTDVDNTTTLKESYRCPREIADVGRRILDGHSDTDARGFDGKSPGGTVEWCELRDNQDLRDAVIAKTDEYSATPSVMLLTRTNYQLRQVMNALQSVGIPFETLGKTGSVWDSDMQQYRRFLKGWQSGSETFAKANVRKVLQTLSGGAERREQLGGGIGSVVTKDAVMPAFDGLTPVETARQMGIAGWKQDALVSVLEAPASMTAGEVRVGTIHTSKGLESPCVYLFVNTTERTVQRYRQNDSHAAEEHRAYYVGATRASEELHLVEKFLDGPIAPPIQKLKSKRQVPA